MPLKCIAIDDEPLALELLHSYARRMNVLDWQGSFDDAIKGLEWLQQHPVDLLFLDVNMPDITGIELARKLDSPPQIIFTTAYKEFAWEGFELEATDYLLKPFGFKRFEKAVEKATAVARQRESGTGDHFILVKSEYRVVKVYLQDIEYIEGLEDYIKINIRNERPVLTLQTLKSMLEKLPAGQFRRIHRSYIVPVNKIKAILNKKVQLHSGKELPVSDSYLDFIRNWKNAT